MLLLGIDIGTSSVKVSVTDSDSLQCIASCNYPETETPILSLQPGWAEQNPEDWWKHTQQAIHKLHASGKYNAEDIGAIGIAYQMHGLVLVDKNNNVLRNSIIWCDSRAVPYGEAALDKLGKDYCLEHLLNSPGNFTAAKLAWVKANEPEIYKQIEKIMLPGDFIALKLTGKSTTTCSALSEGVFWDFKNNSLSEPLFNYFDFDVQVIPEIKDVFAEHGNLSADIADKLKLRKGIPVTYKAGDQPNNALSLNVFKPGEVAVNAGTSGVIYAVADTLCYDHASRVNSFAHVNHKADNNSIGVLLCINGAGITSNWVRSLDSTKQSYNALNESAKNLSVGCDGLSFLPFGNGAERMLNNRLVGAHLLGVDFNKHTSAHIYRAGLEGVACAFRYGLDIMRENGIQPSIVKAGYANMFLSEVFTDAFVNITGTTVELFANDGSVGAAIGAGIGAGVLSMNNAFVNQQTLKKVEVTKQKEYEAVYQRWKTHLNQFIHQ